MANCVDTLVDSVQTSSSNSLVDDLDVQSQSLELPQPQQAVLLSRKVCDGSIRPNLPTGRFPSI